MSRSMKHIEDFARGKTVLSEEQVKILCFILMRATRLLLWMMDRPMMSPHKHIQKNSVEERPPVLASSAGEFLNELNRVLSADTLRGTAKDKE